MAEWQDQLQAALTGRYTLEREIGRGGMAYVFLAHEPKHDRHVALKVLRPDLGAVLGAQRFLREIQVSARLQHPNILACFDSGDAGGLLYYTMPYVEGESLRARLEREGQLPIEDALRITRDVAEALGYAHSHDVVHRDIKPENILLSGGSALVADFGIARAVSFAGGTRLTETGLVLGTPTYMSPEQASGEPRLDGRSDLYAMGCVLYEMLAGQPPFTGPTMQTVLARHTVDPVPSLRTVRRTVPAHVERAVMKSLEKAPADRFATAAQFLQAINAPAVSDPSPDAYAGSAAPAARTALARRTRWRGAAAALSALALAFVAGIYLFQVQARARILSLAILPISSLRGDTATDYLSDGLTIDLINTVSRFPRLAVKSRGVVARFRQPDLDPQRAGRELGVTAILTGSLQAFGDSLRIRVELTRVADGSQLWGTEYRRPSSALLAIQQEIASNILASLHLKLAPRETQQLTRLPTQNPEAHDLYIRGLYFWLRAFPGGHDDDLEKSREFFERAVHSDSLYALAYAGLSNYYGNAAVRGRLKPFSATFARSMEFSRHAMTLDSTLAEPHAGFAVQAMYLNDDWSTAGQELARAVALDAHYAEAHRLYAIYLLAMGRLSQGLEEMRQAVVQEPDIPGFRNGLGATFMTLGWHDSAEAQLKEALRLDPGYAPARNRLIQVYERLGRYAEAVAERRRGPDTTTASAYARAFAASGVAGYREVREAELRRQIDALQAILARPRSTWSENEARRDTLGPLDGQIALMYAELGDARSATNWVLRGYERRPGHLRVLVSNPDVDGLRADPRYLALVRTAGLESLLRREAVVAPGSPRPAADRPAG
jgi:TolB-like protein/Tfp pilus assembly protein PilF